MLSDRLEPVIIFFMYVLLIFGAIWNVTGLFPNLMHYTTSPLMMILGLGVLLSVNKFLFPKLAFWFVITAAITIGLEWLGVETGKVFGQYDYTNYLYPQVMGVPIVIGISWAGVCLGAIGLLQRSRKVYLHSTTTKMLMTGFLMMLFDLLLEPVAIKMGYWHWYNATPPLQNYLGWWIIGSLFSWPVFIILKNVKFSKLAFHSFLAQLIYFGLIILF